MKAFLLISILLCSCAVDPFVKDYPDGHSLASMGGVFAARRKNVVAEITTRNGNHIKFMSEEESGEDVPVTGIQALGTYGGLKLAAGTQDLQTVTDGKVKIGEQGVTKFTEGEKTKRILGTFVPPEPAKP